MYVEFHTYLVIYDGTTMIILLKTVVLYLLDVHFFSDKMYATCMYIVLITSAVFD